MEVGFPLRTACVPVAHGLGRLTESADERKLSAKLTDEVFEIKGEWYGKKVLS